MSQITQLTKIPLAGTKKGIISISNVSEPYGTGTPDVVSIGIALNGEDVEWKAHIPYENIDEVIKALQEAKANK
ncbi:MAG: hypothetical protein WCY75_08365 [Sulfurimonadaceae bacterium]|jgi:hypothetical protein|nr:hypothetical protein [Arcobacteraceae bacterium]MDX9796905.1 hypothetical protein [Arcobacteraceae bacterium]